MQAAIRGRTEATPDMGFDTPQAAAAAVSKPKGLEASTRMGQESKHGDQGEIRIKFTDMAKALPSENVVPLYRNPGQGKEQIEIKVNFAMAYGMTQNFSMSIYSGVIVFRCTFYGKPNSVSATTL